MVDKYEDPFVRIASMIGGDEYLKVARSLLKAEDATDEEIASSTGLRINMVRKVLYDLFGKSLITGIRVKDERKGWFVYRWRTRREEVENFIENQKKKISERILIVFVFVFSINETILEIEKNYKDWYENLIKNYHKNNRGTKKSF